MSQNILAPVSELKDRSSRLIRDYVLLASTKLQTLISQRGWSARPVGRVSRLPLMLMHRIMDRRRYSHVGDARKGLPQHAPIFPGSFPLEIIDMILDHLFDDPVTLKVCSSVCHAWVPCTRYHLFHTIYLDSSKLARFQKNHPQYVDEKRGQFRAYDAFLNLVASSPYIRQGLRHLYIVGNNGMEHASQGSICPGLHAVGNTDNPPRARGVSQSPTQSPTTKQIVVVDPDADALCGIIRHLQQLRILSLQDIAIRSRITCTPNEHSADLAAFRDFMSPNLRKLYIRNVAYYGNFDPATQNGISGDFPSQPNIWSLHNIVTASPFRSCVKILGSTWGQNPQCTIGHLGHVIHDLGPGLIHLQIDVPDVSSDESADQLNIASCINLRSFHLAYDLLSSSNDFAEPLMRALPQTLQELILELVYHRTYEADSRLRLLDEFVHAHFRELDSVTVLIKPSRHVAHRSTGSLEGRVKAQMHRLNGAGKLIVQVENAS